MVALAGGAEVEGRGNVDLYLPDAEEPRSAVVVVHGGPVPADARHAPGIGPVRRGTPGAWPGTEPGASSSTTACTTSAATSGPPRTWPRRGAGAGRSAGGPGPAHRDGGRRATNPSAARCRITVVSDHDKTPRTSSARTWTRVALGALSGLLAGGAALAVAEPVAAAVRPQAGPVVAVGAAAIDRTPTAVKDWAIRTFGANDKLVLQLGILAVLTLFALALGAFAVRHRRTGAAGVLVFGIVGAAAALGRPDSTGVTDALPSVVGAIAGAALLYVLVGLRPAAPPGGGGGGGGRAPPPPPPPPPPPHAAGGTSHALEAVGERVPDPATPARSKRHPPRCPSSAPGARDDHLIAAEVGNAQVIPDDNEEVAVAVEPAPKFANRIGRTHEGGTHKMITTRYAA